MDCKLTSRWILFAALAAIFAVEFACVPPAQAQSDPDRTKEKVLILNAEQEGASCLWPVTLGHNGLIDKPDYTSVCPAPVHDDRELFLRQGKRTELRVFNRKFLTDYSITIDAINSLPLLPSTRNLNEAQSLTLGPAALLSPPSKGGTPGLSSRSTAQILYELLDEGKSSKPQSDLDSDKAVVVRERDQIVAEIDTFENSFVLLASSATGTVVDEQVCASVSAAPNAKTLAACLRLELVHDSQAPNWNSIPYRNEDEFRRVVQRTQDLIAAVAAFAAEISASDLPAKKQKIESDITQYQNDLIILQGNEDATRNAVTLARRLADTRFRQLLRRDQLREFLTKELNPTQSASAPSTQDEADINELLDEYDRSIRRKGVDDRKAEECRWIALSDSANSKDPLGNPLGVNDFDTKLRSIREHLGVDLVASVDEVNQRQSALLNRVNYIYDHSEISGALVKDIDISGHPGNLIVYYTIRRIETFTRFTIIAVPPAPGAAPAANTSAGPTGPPPSQSPAASANPPPATNPVTPNENTGDQSAQLPGIVVSKGSFEVHSFFRFNVAAAFAYSSLKDQSIGDKPTPLGCGGTASAPDPNCYTPVLNGGSNQVQPVILFDAYIHERDTFPRDKYPDQIRRRWICAVDPWQCVGLSGGLSMIKANNYFFGGFFEPILGVQVGGGANFGSESKLQKSYQFGTPGDVTGSFPTYDRRATGWYFAAGLDLGLFRKVFGKVVGLGTTQGSTQGN